MKSERGACGTGGAVGVEAATTVAGNLAPQERQNAASVALGVPQFGQNFWFPSTQPSEVGE